VREWIRDELGPEAAIAERLRRDLSAFAKLPDLINRLETRFLPPPGGEPPPLPLANVKLVGVNLRWRYLAVAAATAALSVAATLALAT
jgi:ubiquinone biosynthesis protein